MMIEQFSSDIYEFLLSIENLGFTLCAVGGLPRDYFYFKTIGHDFDFEIRPNIEIAPKDWPHYLKKLHLFFKEKKLSFTELPYLITRVHFQDYDFEFSSPRTEIAIPENKTHHHFEATLNPNFTHLESFKRRDFTINAIGIIFNFQNKSETIVDPFLGVGDLKNEILTNINDCFFSDSVRFLRMIRFSIKFNKFKISRLLLDQLGRFDLSGLSKFHFCEEIFKSEPSRFLNLFSELVLKYQLILPSDFSVWTRYVFPKGLSSKEEILAYVGSQNTVDGEQVQRFFSMPKKILKDLNSFLASYHNVKRLKEDDFKQLLELPQSVVLVDPILRDLKNLEDKKEWMDLLKINKHDLMIAWSDWNSIEVSSLELKELNPGMRSFYKFYKALKKKFSHD